MNDKLFKYVGCFASYRDGESIFFIWIHGFVKFFEDEWLAVELNDDMEIVKSVPVKELNIFRGLTY